MESMVSHLQIYHKDKLLYNPISRLLSYSAAQVMGIKSYPLCSTCGPEDSPKLVDHVLRHTYEFALRGLPWLQPIVHDPSVSPGSFSLPEDSEHAGDPQQWINEVVHERSVGPQGLKLCDYDRADHSIPAPTNLSEHSGYVLTNRYFGDRPGDNSSRPQSDQSIASDYSTGSAHSDITSRTVMWVAFSPTASEDYTVQL
ncbi:hypothetical protein QBC46DRAFT_407161 [Diplogelasinospora grovesii]|uniref:Uncharacterized protein n=1 Tax=Diplogelasinospora grovesii TaxID=303347 RepID=A0AAN6NCZ8_9PEZI|nr:hypothetical protein QBC46DRAFT_407161 [Diplogelasinospora grovesii]